MEILIFPLLFFVLVGVLVLSLPKEAFYAGFVAVIFAFVPLFITLHLTDFPFKRSNAFLFFCTFVFIASALIWSTLRLAVELGYALMKGWTAPMAIAMLFGVVTAWITIHAADMMAVLSGLGANLILAAVILAAATYYIRGMRTAANRIFIVLVVGLVGLVLVSSLYVTAYAVAGIHSFSMAGQAFCVQLPDKTPLRSVWQMSPFLMMEDGALTHFGNTLSYGPRYGQNHARVIIESSGGGLSFYHWSYRSFAFEPKALVTEILRGTNALEELPHANLTDDFICEPSKDFISTLRWY